MGLQCNKISMLRIPEFIELFLLLIGVSLILPNCAICQHRAEFCPGVAVECLAFSPDNRYFASSGKRTTVIVWDIEKKETQCVLDGHAVPPKKFAFHDNNSIETISYNLKNAPSGVSVFCFDINTAFRKSTFELVGVPIALSSNGSDLLCRSKTDNCIALVYDLRKRKCVQLSVDKIPILELGAISDNGKYVATTIFDKVIKIRLWKMPEGKMLWESSFENNLERLMFAKDGEMLFISGTTFGEVRFLESATGKTVYERRAIGSVTGLVSPDGKWIVTTFSTSKGRDEEVGFRFISSETGKTIKQLKVDKNADGWQWSPNSRMMVLSPDGRFVAAHGYFTKANQDGGAPRPPACVRIFEVTQLKS